jgi:hypothetical protein
LAASSVDGCGAALGAGAGWLVWARAAKDAIGPASRLAAKRTPTNLATHLRAELSVANDFTSYVTPVRTVINPWGLACSAKVASGAHHVRQMLHPLPASHASKKA